MKKLLLTGILISCLVTSSQAQQILTWNTFGNTGTETTEPSTSNDPGLTPSTFTLGAGVTPAGNANRFGGSAWFDTGDTNPTTLSESVAGNDYFEFSVTPLPTFSFTLTDLTFGFDHNANGPSALTIRSSIDGFTADLGTVSALPASLTTGNVMTISGVSAVSTATTFRIYGYGAATSVGQGGFDTSTNVNNIVLNGSVVPEPTTGIMLLGGAGLLMLLRRRHA